MRISVSVPIRGLFNLTKQTAKTIQELSFKEVSVPIRGLFNLTRSMRAEFSATYPAGFRPHQGII